MKFTKEDIGILSVYVLVLFTIIQFSLIKGESSLPITKSETKIDTVVVTKDTTLSVKDKSALFIGDSHTSNNKNGWQKVLCDKTGMKCINASVGGKTTYFMLNMAVYKLNNKLDYCFIYGGANDMYNSNITPQEALDNIKMIAKACESFGITCYVLTGFDPRKCTRTPNPNYVPKYEKLQKLILTNYLNGAKALDVRVVDRVDCWDNLCHMNPNGHRKIANKIIKDLSLEIIK